MSVRVLLVEDDAGLADAIATMLREDGLVVDVESKGRRVVGAIAHTKPDVVVLDVSLKDVEGTVVAGELRACWPEMPIIFATGSVYFADIRKAWPDGRTEVLQKPFEIETLTLAIKRVTRER